MATVSLYSDLRSQPARSVLQFIRLNNIPYEYVNIDLMKGEHKQPPFSDKFRIQQIPAIEHQDLTLVQAGAIFSYLGEAFNIQSQWWPADIKARAQITSYLHWHHSNIRSRTVPYCIQAIFRPRRGIQIAPEVEEKLRNDVNQKLAQLNGYFESFQYLVHQPEASVADLMLYNEIDQLTIGGYDISEYPNLVAWKSRIDAIEEVEGTKEQIRGVFAS